MRKKAGRLRDKLSHDTVTMKSSADRMVSSGTVLGPVTGGWLALAGGLTWGKVLPTGQRAEDGLPAAAGA